MGAKLACVDVFFYVFTSYIEFVIAAKRSKIMAGHNGAITNRISEFE